MANWFSNAVSWISEQAQGVNNWIADQVGDVWDGVGSTLGFETTAQAKRRKETEAATEAWNKQRQALTDSWNAYKDEWTGVGGSQKAYNLAKAATGSITAAQTNEAVNEAATAQRNVGVNKAQAAMNASNLAGSTYANTYDVDTQAEQVSKQIQKQSEAMEDAYNKEMTQGEESYQQQLANIAAKKNSDLGIGAQITVGDLFGHADDEDFGKVYITSDENSKDNLLEVNADTCALFLLTILKDFEIHDAEDIELIKIAAQFLDLYKRRREDASK